MAVSVGDLITAAQFNSLQGRIESVLGNGVNDFGYGQPVTSSQVSTGSTITASRLGLVRNDIENAYAHQTGNTIDSLLTEIDAGDVIGADVSGTDLAFSGNNYTFVDQAPLKGFNDYLSIMSSLESNRFGIDASQQEIAPSLTSDTRSSSWSYVKITSEVVVSFATANARRHFFNSGGELRIAGAVTNLGGVEGESHPRNKGWQDIVTNPGYVKFGYNYMGNSNANATNVQYPQTQNFGNYQLTSAYTTILRKQSSGAGGVYGNVYEDSFWTVEARQDSATSIRFRISLTDGGPETLIGSNEVGTIQEPVTADIRFDYGARRADKSDFGVDGVLGVDNPFPAFTVVNSFQ